MTDFISLTIRLNRVTNKVDVIECSDPSVDLDAVTYDTRRVKFTNNVVHAKRRNPSTIANTLKWLETAMLGHKSMSAKDRMLVDEIENSLGGTARLLYYGVRPIAPQTTPTTPVATRRHVLLVNKELRR